MSFNMAGPDCPDCGLPTHRVEHDGEVRLRCVSNGCGRGWYES